MVVYSRIFIYLRYFITPIEEGKEVKKYIGSIRQKMAEEGKKIGKMKKQFLDIEYVKRGFTLLILLLSSTPLSLPPS